MLHTAFDVVVEGEPSVWKRVPLMMGFWKITKVVVGGYCTDRLRHLMKHWRIGIELAFLIQW